MREGPFTPNNRGFAAVKLRTVVQRRIDISGQLDLLTTPLGVLRSRRIGRKSVLRPTKCSGESATGPGSCLFALITGVTDVFVSVWMSAVRSAIVEPNLVELAPATASEANTPVGGRRRAASGGRPDVVTPSGGRRDVITWMGDLSDESTRGCVALARTTCRYA